MLERGWIAGAGGWWGAGQAQLVEDLGGEGLVVDNGEDAEAALALWALEMSERDDVRRELLAALVSLAPRAASGRRALAMTSAGRTRRGSGRAGVAAVG